MGSGSMMRPYEWGSWTQEMGRRSGSIEDTVNGQQKQHCGKRVKMAGSYHDRFEERSSRRVLICYIDDAAREMFERFYDEEQRYLR